MGRTYLIYDQRAYTMGTDNAQVMCAAMSLQEARSDRDSMFPGCPIFSYGNSDNLLVDERLEE